MSQLIEYAGNDSPSMVFIVSRRWDLPGEPWQLGERVDDGIEWQDCADHQKLFEALMSAIGFECRLTHIGSPHA